MRLSSGVSVPESRSSFSPSSFTVKVQDTVNAQDPVKVQDDGKAQHGGQGQPKAEGHHNGKMETAIVLQGGGALGAYEYGVLKGGTLLARLEGTDLLGVYDPSEPTRDVLFGVNTRDVNTRAANGSTFPKVAVLGLGTMGAGIAQVVAASGRDVVVLETDRARIDRGLDAVRAFLDGGVERGKTTSEQRDAVLGRIRGTTDVAELAGVDLVI